MATVEHHDIVVVGARVAGCLTASLLAQGGADVLVVDRARIPSPTLSTHFFRGEYLIEAITAADLLDDVLALGAPRLIREFNYDGGGAVPSVGPAQSPGAAGYNLSVRREVLDPTLLAGARRQGVRIETGTRVVDVVLRDGVAAGVRLEGDRTVDAGLVIGADGYRSLVATAVQAPDREVHPGRRALYYRYVRRMAAPDGRAPDGVEFSLLGDELAYVFPSDGDWTCVALSINLSAYERFRHDAAASFDKLLRRHTGVWPRYADATDHGRILGAGPRDDFLRCGAGPGWALVGDAGIHQDPWCGKGMDTAGVSSKILAEAILRGTLVESYEADRNVAVLDWFHDTVAGARDLSLLAD